MGLNNFNPKRHQIFNTHILSNGIISASVALCQSRHDIPGAVDGAIFPQVIEDPADIPSLERYAASVIKATGVTDLTLYVTGLTQALCAVLKACLVYCVTVTLMHYNTATGKYVSQPMI